MNPATSKHDLGAAVIRYVAAANPIITANLQPGELPGMPGGGRWKSTGPGQFQRDEAPRILWAVAIHRRHDQLHALPEYHAVEEVIEANERWRGQFGTLVGSWHSRMRLDLDWFLDGCIGDALSALATHEDPEVAVRRRVSTMEQLLDATNITGEVVGPLMGFNAAGVGRVELASGVAIEPIDVAEVESLVSVGLLTPMMPDFPLVHAPTHMVRATYQTPKVVGEAQYLGDPTDLLNEWKPAEEAVEDLLVCLRLLKPGLVVLSGTANIRPSYLGRSWSVSPGGGPLLSPHFHNSYVLQVDEVPTLKSLWDQLHSHGVRLTKQLTLAARRFAYKSERRRLDDQLVDLMVAAEALFLGEGDEDARGELRFRLSSRAASYIDGSGRDRRSIFRLFMAAYRMRSRLVHGGVAKPVTLGDEEFTPEKMVETIETLLRAALKQVLAEGSRGSQRWSVDWEVLLFPSRSTSEQSSAGEAGPSESSRGE